MISIIVPIYNSAKWLKRCVNSLIGQTYRNIEILLINDGSKDNSLNICNEYAKKDNRIVVIDKKNTGVSATRNAGLKAAKGEYIQFVDSDDYIEPQMCEMLVKAIDNSDMVICGMRIWKDDIVLREPHIDDGIYTLKDNIDIYFQLRKINLGPCNKLYRRELIKNYFIENISLGEDTIFVLEYMRNVQTISVLSECLYNVVLDNENSLNKKKNVDTLSLLIEQRKEEENVLTEIYGTDSDFTQIYNQYLYNVHAHFLNLIKMGYEAIKSEISIHINNALLQEKIKRSAPKRWDMKIFKSIFLKKHIHATCLYFKIKTIYYGNRRRKNGCKKRI